MFHIRETQELMILSVIYELPTISNSYKYRESYRRYLKNNDLFSYDINKF